MGKTRRCKAKTKKNKRCTRKVLKYEDYCFQHINWYESNLAKRLDDGAGR